MRALLFPAIVVCAILGLSTGISRGAGDEFKVAAGPQAQPADQGDKAAEPSPEEKMKRRFPQPVQVDHLIGLPVLDGGDSTIGYIQQVVRTPDGKIQLIVPYGRLGFISSSAVLDRRPVAVPIEAVAILARQVNALEMSLDDFDAAPTWSAAQGQAVPGNEIIQIAIGRR